jgi:hypothetical protein
MSDHDVIVIGFSRALDRLADAVDGCHIAPGSTTLRGPAIA